MPNVELLERTLAYIEELALADEKGEPVTDTAGVTRRWQQSAWTELTPITWNIEAPKLPKLCGTACCFAGWAVILEAEADTPEKVLALFDIYDIDGDLKLDDPATVQGMPISVRASELLGLDGYQASRLFNGSNSLEELRGIVSQLIELG